jgi:hypothetical protein
MFGFVKGALRVRHLATVAGVLLAPLPFFIALTLYLRFSLNTRLIYHAFGILLDFPTIKAGSQFIGTVLVEPGGAAHALGTFLSHGYYYAWLGALTITSIAFLAWLGTQSLLAQFARRRVPWLGYVPILILLVAYEGLENPIVEAVSFLTVLWCCVFYYRFAIASLLLRLALTVVLNVLLYAAVGPAGLVFALLAALHEGLVGRRTLLATTSLLFGAAIPLVMALTVYDMPVVDAYTRILPLVGPDPDRTFYAAAALYLFLPAAAAIAFLVGHLRRRSTSAESSAGAWRWPRMRKALSLCCGVLLPFAAAMLVIPVARSERRRLDIRMTSLSMRQMWPDMLDLVRAIPRDMCAEPYFNHEICKALYFNGLLGDELFSFPQKLRGLDLMGSHTAMPGTRHAVPFLAMADVALNLGELNYAEKLAYEALEARGEAPMVLERLVLISIAKQRLETATILLNAMRRIPFHREAASSLLEQLKADSTGDTDAHVRHLRSLMLLEDYVERPTVFIRLDNLLKRNPSNHMAFEYRMAALLLNGDPAGVVQGLERLRDNGREYRRLPRHYEEAMAIQELRTAKPVVIGDCRVSTEMQERALRFARKARQLQDRPDEARRTLAPEFGDTYFFFLLFNSSATQQ